VDLLFVVLIVVAVGALLLAALAWRLYEMAWPERKQSRENQGPPKEPGH
jgi:hypothetical protein